MEISVSTAQGRVPVTILRVQGNLDAANADEFNAAANKAVKDGALDILLDFTQVQFMSSIGIRSLSMLYDLLHPGTEHEKDAIHSAMRANTYTAAHLKLLNVNPRLRSTLDFVMMDRYLEMFTDEQAAIASF